MGLRRVAEHGIAALGIAMRGYAERRLMNCSTKEWSGSFNRKLPNDGGAERSSALQCAALNFECSTKE